MSRKKLDQIVFILRGSESFRIDTSLGTNALLDQDEFTAASRQEAEIALHCVLQGVMGEELTALLQA